MTKKDGPNALESYIHRASEGVGQGEDFVPWTAEQFPRTYATLEAMRKVFVEPPELHEGFAKLFPPANALYSKTRAKWIGAIETVNDDVALSRAIGGLSDKVLEAVDHHMMKSLIGPGAAVVKDSNREKFDKLREKHLSKRVNSVIDVALKPLDLISDVRRRVRTSLSGSIMIMHTAATESLEEWKEESDRKWRAKWGIKSYEEKQGMVRQLLRDKGFLEGPGNTGPEMPLADQLIELADELKRDLSGPRGARPDDPSGPSL